MTLIGKKLERVQLTDTKVKLVMPDSVYHEIQYLCREIPKVEWSGVLFYEIEGTIQKPEEAVFTLKAILPMHKGTGTYTEYSFGPEVIEFMEDNNLDDCKMGHIHSHNSMGVFFSGTDWSELEDNAPNHNFYLSLIVNNYMEFCAKVCFIAESGEAKEVNYTAKDETGKRYVYSSESYNIESKRLITYDCDIVSPSQGLPIRDDFREKVKGIIEAADKRTVVATTINSSTTRYGLASSSGWSRTQQQLSSQSDDQAGWEDWAPSDSFKETEKQNEKKATESFQTHEKKQGEKVEKSWQVDKVTGKWEWKETPTVKKEETKASKNFRTGGPKNPAVKSMLNYDLAWEQVIPDFAMYVVNNGNSTEEYGDIQDILTFYSDSGVGGKALCDSIIKNYSNIYDAYFEELKEKNQAKVFIEITQGVADELTHQADMVLPTLLGQKLNLTILSLDGLVEDLKEKLKNKTEITTT